MGLFDGGDGYGGTDYNTRRTTMAPSGIGRQQTGKETHVPQQLTPPNPTLADRISILEQQLGALESVVENQREHNQENMNNICKRLAEVGV